MEFKIRIEELPVVARFLRNSLGRDITDFSNFSPIFNAAYRTNLDTKITQVESVITTSFYTKDLKKLTDTMYADIDSLRPMMLQLEGWVKLAGKNLAILPKDFGIKEVRSKIKNKDVEGLLLAVKKVGENVQTNATALGTVGATTAAATAVQNLMLKIKNENDQQNIKLGLREQAVQANTNLFNELWGILSEVMYTGKRIYKFTNKAKLDDYTLAVLLRRIRQEQKKKDEEEKKGNA